MAVVGQRDASAISVEGHRHRQARSLLQGQFRQHLMRQRDARHAEPRLDQVSHALTDARSGWRRQLLFGFRADGCDARFIEPWPL